MSTLNKTIAARYTEDVGGIIIGGDDGRHNYEFWQDGQPIPQAQHRFAADAEAIAWFRERWPARYAAGAEMRVYA